MEVQKWFLHSSKLFISSPLRLSMSLEAQTELIGNYTNEEAQNNSDKAPVESLINCENKVFH